MTTEPPTPLAALGLSAPEQSLYQRLLRLGPATIGEIHPDWPHRESIRSTMDLLRRNGFVSRLGGQPVRYLAVTPRTAFDRALIDRAEQLRRAREHAELLVSAHRAAAPVDETDVVQQVVGRTEVLEVLGRALQSTRSSLRMLLRQPPGPGIQAAIGVLHAAGIAVRAVHERGDEPLPGVLPTATMRAAQSVPASLYLIDDRLAVVLTDDVGSAVLVQPCELLTMLGLLADALWDDAGPAANDPDDRRLIGLLLSGLTDAGIARTLGVSPRTAQRRVAAFMQAAGARTRFQAGVQAALRHRVDEADR